MLVEDIVEDAVQLHVLCDVVGGVQIDGAMATRTRSAPKRRIMPFPIRLEPSRRARLQELAKADRRSLSNYILKVLYDHIDAMDAARDKPRK